jgi:hypothetical protein
MVQFVIKISYLAKDEDVCTIIGGRKGCIHSKNYSFVPAYVEMKK